MTMDLTALAKKMGLDLEHTFHEVCPGTDIPGIKGSVLEIFVSVGDNFIDNLLRVSGKNTVDCLQDFRVNGSVRVHHDVDVSDVSSGGDKVVHVKIPYEICDEIPRLKFVGNWLLYSDALGCLYGDRVSHLIELIFCKKNLKCLKHERDELDFKISKLKKSEEGFMLNKILLNIENPSFRMPVELNNELMRMNDPESTAMIKIIESLECQKKIQEEFLESYCKAVEVESKPLFNEYEFLKSRSEDLDQANDLLRKRLIGLEKILSGITEQEENWLVARRIMCYSRTGDSTDLNEALDSNFPTQDSSVSSHDLENLKFGN